MTKTSEGECICTQLRRAARVVGRAYDAALEPLGLGSAQYAILIHIRRAGTLAQMALADELDMERTTLYRALDILAGRGLVAMARADKGVAKNVSLTARGESVTAAAEKRWRRVHEKFKAGFGADSLAALNRTLGRVRAEFRA